MLMIAAQGPQSPIIPVIFGVMVIICLAKISGTLAEKLGQPAVLGELLTGVALGNFSLLGIDQLEFLKVDYSSRAVIDFHDPAHCAGITIDVLAGLGVILLLFCVGLKTSLADILKSGRSALTIALAGVLVPFSSAWIVSSVVLQGHWLLHIFIGAAMTATSIGITARVLEDSGYIESAEARLILSASVLDDVLGLLALAAVQALVIAEAREELVLTGLITVIIKATAFLAAALLFGHAASRQVVKAAGYLKGRGLLLISALFFWLCWRR